MSKSFGKKNGAATKLTTAPDLLKSAPQRLLIDTLALAIGQGAAVMLGGTRDGAALVITLMDGDRREKEYCHDKDELREALTNLAADFSPPF